MVERMASGEPDGPGDEPLETAGPPTGPAGAPGVAGPASDARFRLLVESATEFAMITMDVAGTIETWNSGAERLLGWPADEAVGRAGAMIFVPEDVAAGVPEREIATALAQGRALDERWHRRKDGSRFWGSGMMLPLRDDQGRRFGLAKILRDLTDQRQDQQLQSSQRIVLEQIARGTPLPAVLAAVVDLLDSQIPHARADIRLTAALGGSEGGVTAGPTAPAAGPGAPAADGAVAVRAWTTAILDAHGERLGAVIVTFDAPAIPTTREQGVMDVAVQLAATAIGRQRLETALGEERARERDALTRAFELSPTFLAVLAGPEHVFVLANPAYRQLIGHREVLGLGVRDALPEVSDQGFVELLDRVYHTGEPFVGHELLVQVQRTPGAEREERFLDFVYQPTRGSDGAIDGVLVSGVDVTDAVLSRQAVERLADERDVERRRLETVLAQSPLAIGLVEAPSGRILFMNARFAELFGHAPALEHAAEYSEHYKGFHLDGRPIASDEWPIVRAIRRGEVIEGEVLEIEPRGGLRRTVTANAAPVRDAEGRIVAGVVLFWDVTTQRRAEQQLRDAERMQAVGTLAGGVAHEVNNQMTAVLGFGAFVLRALGPSHPQAADLRLVLQAADRAARVSQQLLTFTRQQVMQPRVLDLPELVLRLAPVLRQLLGADKELVVPARAVTRPIFADPGQVEQVLINLVANARDATETGDRVTIEAEDAELGAGDGAGEAGVPAPGPYVCLTVADTGHGMDAATRARIFDPFFTTKPVGSGTGLGLSLVYGVVTKHGGHLAVKSERGRGTTLTIYWPAAQQSEVEVPAEAASGAAAEAAADGGGETVVVVEDDAIVRALAERTLEAAGFRVVGAADGEAALALLHELPAPPALVVTDAIMPRMNGRQLADAVGLSHPGLPVLYMSGYTGEDMVRRRLVPEGAPYLQKPFTPDRLERAVRELLDRARRRDS